MECFEKLQVCIETGRTFIVIVTCKLWGVTGSTNDILKINIYTHIFIYIYIYIYIY